MFTGGRSGGRDIINSFSLKKEKCFFLNGKNEATGKTYLEQRKETAWGNVGIKSENTNIRFNTKEERLNFWKIWNTKIMLWYFNKIKVDVHVHPEFLPYMNDYSHEWTDEELYKFFDLTEDEIKLIESEIK